MTKDEFKAYCARWSLTFVDAVDLDEGEWPETAAVGFFDDPSYGAAGAHLLNTGKVYVVTAFCDGRRRMEDEWRAVTESELASGRRLHAVE